MKERTKNIITLAITFFISILLVEPLFRLASGIPVFHVEDFRFTRVIRVAYDGLATYDPNLGWSMNPNVEREIKHPNGKLFKLSTMEYGIRRNGLGDDRMRTGGVLVSGSSFAGGAEGNDDEAFPSLLETLIKKPVVNGSIGGFGTDQSVLRAEELLPIVKPETLIIDIAVGNITITSFSVNGRPKPYFLIEDGRLVLHNTPVPKAQPTKNKSLLDTLKPYAGYSFAIDRLMATLAPDAWYSDGSSKYARVNNDGVTVTCLLLEKLRHQAKDIGARMLMTVQYGSTEIASLAQRPYEIMLVEECARDLNIGVLDEFEIMKKTYEENRADFASQFVPNPGGVLGHKSRYGNLKVAERIATALPTLPPADAPIEKLKMAGMNVRASDAPNLLTNPDALAGYRSDIVKVSNESIFGGVASFRLTAAGPAGEHYVGLAATLQDGGDVTFSLEAKGHTTPRLILVILNRDSKGGFSEFDLDNETASTQRLGAVRSIAANIRRTDDGWYQLALSTKIPDPGPLTVYIKVADQKGSSSFAPSNESIKVRRLKVQRSGP